MHSGNVASYLRPVCLLPRGAENFSVPAERLPRLPGFSHLHVKTEQDSGGQVLPAVAA